MPRGGPVGNQKALKHGLHSMKANSSSEVSTNRQFNGGGAPPGNKNAVKHGLHTYKAMLDGNGLDERTSLFKAL